MGLAHATPGPSAGSTTRLRRGAGAAPVHAGSHRRLGARAAVALRADASTHRLDRSARLALRPALAARRLRPARRGQRGSRGLRRRLELGSTRRAADRGARHRPLGNASGAGPRLAGERAADTGLRRARRQGGLRLGARRAWRADPSRGLGTARVGHACPARARLDARPRAPDPRAASGGTRPARRGRRRLRAARVRARSRRGRALRGAHRAAAARAPRRTTAVDDS